ncbi:MAG TPA: MBL fold metallo-hydrolase [Acidimicrobiales bacterium]|nr:MBL fold metallo-hydrolase [Acidimicrobiales bacterium]
MTLHVVTIETPALGDRSYLAHDGEAGVLIDPQRDLDRALAAAESARVRVTHVLETHIHNDYVTGGLALAEELGASYVVAAGEEVDFDRLPAVEGMRFQSGSLAITAMHTPGHTPYHLSYTAGIDGSEPQAVFTGGSMLYGSVGRTDLVGPELTESLTRDQYHSVRHLARVLPPGTQVFPTHGFGSFCSAVETTGTSSTIGDECRTNIAVRLDDEDVFVKTLMEGLAAYPRYYAHMAPLNRQGPGAADLTPPVPVDASELLRRIDAREWVVDLRDRTAFARRHVAGTISVELGDSFSTFLGWVIAWNTPLTLIADSPHQIAEAQRQLSRIGIDRLAGAATGGIGQLAGGLTASYPVGRFDDLYNGGDHDGRVILDVRRPDEWRAGHLSGAIHIPFWEIESRVGEIPAGEVWVYCASGFRASIAVSLLDRAGRRAVLIDDDWARAAELGLPLSYPERRGAP